MTGFVLSNNLLIIAGSLVGAVGLILTHIMCKAMNRSLANVLFGGFGAETAAAAQSAGYKNVKSRPAPRRRPCCSRTPSRWSSCPATAWPWPRRSTCARSWRDCSRSAASRCSYAIHPVAGRMPGHMNVLLAEADVPYEQLFEMDEINPSSRTPTWSSSSGANDVVNPAALNDKTSPIYGMPILNTHEARTVFIIKRSLAPGSPASRTSSSSYDNAIMFFGDAKKVLTEVVAEVKELD